MRSVHSDDGRVRRRLETWGEIAAHLGIEVRTAQRWERRLGLPVKRTQGSQAVFAFVDEIDGWLASRQVEGAPAGVAPALKSEPVHEEGRVARLTGSLPHRVSSSWKWAATAMFALAVVGAGVVALRPSAEIRTPVRLDLEGHRLVATDGAGRVLWFHDLPAPVRTINIVFRPNLSPAWERIDVDGDGIDELVVVVAHSAIADGTTETLYCFTLQGRLRYSLTPDLTLNFRQASYSGPWRFWDIESVPEDGSLWVALETAGWWPSVVMRVDGRGVASIRYAQPGLIGSVATMREKGQTRILAGGVNNDFGAASLAVLDLHAQPSTAPRKGEGPYDCSNCPDGLPVAYMLFPPSPLNIADGQPYNRIERLVVRPTEIEVSTYEADLARVLYSVSLDLLVKSATPSDGYWTWKPRFDPTWGGRERHSPATTVRTWTAAGWGVQTAPFAGFVIGEN